MVPTVCKGHLCVGQITHRTVSNEINIHNYANVFANEHNSLADMVANQIQNQIFAFGHDRPLVSLFINYKYIYIMSIGNLYNIYY